MHLELKSNETIAKAVGAKSNQVIANIISKIRNGTIDLDYLIYKRFLEFNDLDLKFIDDWVMADSYKPTSLK